MLSPLKNVTAHFSRFKVTQIGLSDAALAQFDDSEILRAAELLADAKVDVIAWIGTSASWLGFDRDERLVERIFEVTGIRACTCVLAFREAFHRAKIREIGLVTPYTDDVQQRIIRVWENAGFRCCAERHLGMKDNFSFGLTAPRQIESMIRQVVNEGAKTVAIVCTNLMGASLVSELENELGVQIFDSVAVTVWKCLNETGIAPSGLDEWGRLFRKAR
jgi:maleate isomerase